MLLDDFNISSKEAGITLIKKSHALTNPRRHFHTWWEILYIESGKRTVLYNTQVLNISAGTFCVIPPLTLHRAINADGETCSLYNLFFSVNEKSLSPVDSRLIAIQDILQSIKGFTVLNEQNRSEVSDLFHKTALELHTKGEGFAPLAWSYITELIIGVKRSNKSVLKPSSFINDKFSKMPQVLEYINENINDESLSLKTTAELFGFSPSNLSRLFNECTRFSFIEYINSIRITNACKLLKTSQQSILEIAYNTGFGSVTQFDRCFKKLTGVPPHSYRQS